MALARPAIGEPGPAGFEIDRKLLVAEPDKS